MSQYYSRNSNFHGFIWENSNRSPASIRNFCRPYSFTQSHRMTGPSRRVLHPRFFEPPQKPGCPILRASAKGGMKTARTAIPSHNLRSPSCDSRVAHPLRLYAKGGLSSKARSPFLPLSKPNQHKKTTGAQVPYPSIFRKLGYPILRAFCEGWDENCLRSHIATNTGAPSSRQSHRR
jgi:hypothetical protein